MIPRGQDPVGVTALPANNMSQYEISSSAIACEKDQNIASYKFTFPSCSQHIYVHLGMYMSTYSPASFCMMKVGFGFSEKMRSNSGKDNKVQNHKQGVNFGQILKYLLLLFPP